MRGYTDAPTIRKTQIFRFINVWARPLNKKWIRVFILPLPPLKQIIGSFTHQFCSLSNLTRPQIISFKKKMAFGDPAKTQIGENLRDALLTAGVDTGDRGGALHCGADPEAAAVATEVQHALPRAHTRYHCSIVTLREKKMAGGGGGTFSVLPCEGTHI
jgi:hypothetical protein